MPYVVDSVSGAVVPVPRTWHGTVDPAATNDTGHGTNVGDIWVNAAAQRVLFCIDNTANAAMWTPGSGSPPIIVQQTVFRRLQQVPTVTAIVPASLAAKVAEAPAQRGPRYRHTGNLPGK